MLRQMEMIAAPDSDGDRDSWATPDDLFRRLDSEFHFVHDICAEAWSAKCESFWTRHDDAFGRDWAGELTGFGWCNPPFSELPAWVSAAGFEAQRGARIVMLLPAHRCEQEWFHRYVLDVATEVRFIRKRVNYVPPPGITGDSAKFPSMIVVYDGPSTGATTLGGL